MVISIIFNVILLLFGGVCVYSIYVYNGRLRQLDEDKQRLREERNAAIQELNEKKFLHSYHNRPEAVVKQDERLKKLTEENRRLKQTIAQTRQGNVSGTQEMTKQLNALKLRNQALDDQIKQMKNREFSLESEIKGLKNTISSLERTQNAAPAASGSADMAQLKSRLHELESELKRKTTECSELDVRCRKLEARIDQENENDKQQSQETVRLQSRIQELEQAGGALQAKYQSLAEQLRAAQDRLSKTDETEIRRQAQAYAELEERSRVREQELETLQSRIRTMEAKLYDAEIGNNRAENTAYDRRTVEAALKQKEAEIDRLQERVASMERDVTYLQKECRAKAKAYADLQKDQAALEREYERLLQTQEETISDEMSVPAAAAPDDRYLKMATDCAELDEEPDAVYLHMSVDLSGGVRLSNSGSYRNAAVVLLPDGALIPNPYYYSMPVSGLDLMGLERLFVLPRDLMKANRYCFTHVEPARAENHSGRITVVSQGRLEAEIV